MLTATTFGLGIISHIDDPYTFKITGMVLRFIQGQGDVLLQITSYTIITSVYKEDQLKYIGYIEVVVGLGLAMGPTIGATVYSTLDYSGTMYLFGMLNLLTTLICFWVIPNEID